MVVELLEAVPPEEDVVVPDVLELELAELELTELDPVLVGSEVMILNMTITPIAAINQVNREVFFGALAPHFGQTFALVLTSEPHSLHLTSAMPNS